MYSFMPRVEEILTQYSIPFSEQVEPEHITIKTDELMVDPGFGRDKKVLDLFIDEDNKIIFIGLLRIPCQNRRMNIGSQIVSQIADWAKDSGYTIFLDGCGDSCVFWSKCGFSLVTFHCGFEIMGLGSDRKELKEKWKIGKRIFDQTH